MKNIQDLEKEFERLEQKIRDLEKSSTGPTHILLGEMVDIKKELNSLKVDMEKYKSEQVGKKTESSPSREYSTVSKSNIIQMPMSPVSESVSKKSFTEENIGKYFLPVLASVLVLLAIVIIAKTFWYLIPNFIKLCSIFIIGVLCELCGWKLYERSNRNNRFWLSILGLGSAIIFIDIIFGQTLWNLYSVLSVSLGFIIWFLVHLMISHNVNSNVAYTITYLGAIIASILIFDNATLTNSSEVILIFITVIMYLIGHIGSRINKNKFLSVLNFVFLWNIFFLVDIIISECITVDFDSLGVPTNTNIIYTPVILIISQVVLAAIILYITPKISKIMCNCTTLGGAIVCLASTYIFAAACLNICYFRSVDLIPIMEIAVIIIITAIGIVCWKYCKEYVLGTSLVVTGLLCGVSYYLVGIHSFIPMIACTIFISIPKIRKDSILKYSVVFMYAISLFNMMLTLSDENISDILLIFTAVAAMLFPILNSLLVKIKCYGIYQLYELLLTPIVSPIPLGILLSHYSMSNMIYITFMTVILIAVKCAINRLGLIKCHSDKSLVGINFFVLSLVSCLSCYFNMLFFDYTVDYSLIPLVLIIYSVVSVSKSVHSHKLLFSVLSGVFCHLNIFFIISFWYCKYVDITITCAGIVLSAMLIAIGFLCKNKNTRIVGLVSLICYVLKLSIYDITLYDTNIGRVFGLLFGGIVCFSVGFAYSKLNKRYGGLSDDSNN